jgi:hypothetical protein
VVEDEFPIAVAELPDALILIVPNWVVVEDELPMLVAALPDALMPVVPVIVGVEMLVAAPVFPIVVARRSC